MIDESDVCSFDYNKILYFVKLLLIFFEFYIQGCHVNCNKSETLLEKC